MSEEQAESTQAMPSKLPLEIDTIFGKAEEKGASDIHLAVGKPPMGRYQGRIGVIEGYEEQTLDNRQVDALIKSMLVSSQQERYVNEREIDFSYQLKNGGTRFRVNCHFEKDNPGLVARVIPESIPSMEDIQMPAITAEFTSYDRGIVLCTGPTGSGKSTTLASMIETINKERPVHIITLEDPIEFLYHSQKAIVRQRQFGTDFISFGEALRRVLRQDPDVILVGEMRDLETIAAALTLAETGHLVFATLHTPSAAQTIDRIVDVFPPHQQSQIRTQLSTSLRAVLAQRLVPREGGGRVAIREIMINTPAIGNIIRESRIAELQNVIQTSAEEGMITYERDAARLYGDGLLSREVAENFVEDAALLKQLSRKSKKKGLFG